MIYKRFKILHSSIFIGNRHDTYPPLSQNQPTYEKRIEARAGISWPVAGEDPRCVGPIRPRGPIDGQSVASVFGVNADVSLRLYAIGNAFSRVPIIRRRDYAITLP